MLSRPLRILVALAPLLGSASALAQHAGDVYARPTGGVVETGAVSGDGTIDAPELVFAAEFGDSGFPAFTANPGFNSLPGEWPVGSRLGWNALAGLRVWNGNGFDPAGDETLLVDFGSQDFTIADGPVAGFDIAVQADGGFHKHLNFFLEAAGDPDAGVYLVELEMYSTSASIDPSPPFWIVFDNEAPDEIDAALAWVLENLAGGAGCPADITGPGGEPDGNVDALDFLELIAQWGCPSPPCTADIAGPGGGPDGTVDAIDFLELIAQWGTPGNCL
jgi:hypothetical protein